MSLFRKKQFVILAIIILVLLFAFLIGLILFKNTSFVNGKPLKGVKESNVEEKYLEKYYAETHTFHEKDLNEKYVKTEIKNFQKKDTNIFGRPEYTFDVKNTLDEDAFRRYLDEYNASAEVSVDAAIVDDEKSGAYKVSDEVYGKQVEVEPLVKDAKSDKTDIQFKSYYIKPKYYAKNLKSSCEKLNQILAWNITYSDGNIANVTKQDITVNADGSYEVADLDYKKLLNTINASYSTVGDGFDVKLHDGSMEKVEKGTWGKYVDKKAELKYIKDAYSNLKSESDRTPIMAGKENDFSQYDGDLIIEVSIAKQHLWAYDRSGNIKMDFDVVTGKKNAHDTPTGVFYISECRKDYVMKGENDDGTTYESHCQRFMRLNNNGVALHDASWRNKFGGDLYVSHGSHGCVNCPVDKALALSEIITIGKTMVIIH